MTAGDALCEIHGLRTSPNVRGINYRAAKSLLQKRGKAARKIWSLVTSLMGDLEVGLERSRTWWQQSLALYFPHHHDVGAWRFLDRCITCFAHGASKFGQASEQTPLLKGEQPRKVGVGWL